MKNSNQSVIILLFTIAGIIVIWLLSKTNFLQPQPTPTITSSETNLPSTETFTPTITFTLPPTFDASIASTTFCHLGPNDSLVGATPLSKGMEVEILAISDTEDWFMIRSTALGLAPCWVEKNSLLFTEKFDPRTIQVFTTIKLPESINCQDYPDVGRPAKAIIPQARRIVAYGKLNIEATWILVVPQDSTSFCWIENRSGLDYPNLPIEAPDFTFTATPTATLTLTPTVARQAVVPTNTPRSGGGNNDNPTPIPPTNTPNPAATNTPVPPPTNTPIPPPTNTPVPPPTDTPIPPTPTLCWPPGQCKNK